MNAPTREKCAVAEPPWPPRKTANKSGRRSLYTEPELTDTDLKIGNCLIKSESLQVYFSQFHPATSLRIVEAFDVVKDICSRLSLCSIVAPIDAFPFE